MVTVPIGAPDIRELDTGDETTAVALLAPLFEGAPRFLVRLVAARPFGDWPTLFGVARRLAHSMPEAEQIELLDAHPRLGAPPATVSALSFQEQGYGRSRTDEAAAAASVSERLARELGRLPVAEALGRLSAEYEARFGFRYCVFVAGRSPAELLPQLVAALDADRDGELHRALDAVVDIAIARRARLAEGS